MSERMRLLSAGLVTAAVTACGGGGDAGQRFMLRYHPPAGALFQYEIEQEMRMAFAGGGVLGALAGLGGNAQFKVHMFITQTVGDSVGSSVQITTLFDSATFESPTIPRAAMDDALHRVRGVRTAMVFDDRMQVVRAESQVPGQPAVPQQFSSGLRAMTFTLPEEPVKTGDQWTVDNELPMGDVPGLNRPIVGHTTLTILDVHAVGPDTTIRVGFETTFPREPIEMDVEGKHVTFTFSGSLKGEQEFSMLLGTTLGGTSDGTVNMTINAGSVGATASMSIGQRTTVRLKT